MKNYWKVGRWMDTTKHRIGLVVLLLSMMLTTTAGFAEQVNLVKNGDAETGRPDNWKGFTQMISENAHSGDYCFLSQATRTVHSIEFIPVDPDKTYTLTGWFKSFGMEQSRLYFGYMPYDAERKRILAQEVNCTAGTETTLIEACKKEDTVIKIADGSKWKTYEYAFIAFEVDDSGNYGDLPNRKLSSMGITKVENKEDHWEIHLKEKCNKAYPAGTKVRLQTATGTYIYNAAGNKAIPMEWTECTGRIKGVATKGAPPKQWWRGTSYVQILLLTNHRQDKEFELLIDDISMTESQE